MIGNLENYWIHLWEIVGFHDGLLMGSFRRILCRLGILLDNVPWDTGRVKSLDENMEN